MPSHDLPGILAEYNRDYRADCYLRLLEGAASADGVGESKRAVAAFLGCGRQHADTVATNLVRRGLVGLTWDADRREWLYRATEPGKALLNPSFA